MTWPTKESFSLRKGNETLQIDPLPDGTLNFWIDDGFQATQLGANRLTAQELVKYLQLWLGDACMFCGTRMRHTDPSGTCTGCGAPENLMGNHVLLPPWDAVAAKIKAAREKLGR